MNILIFPCGTEIGLEIKRSLKGVKNIRVFGLNSVEDASSLVFENISCNSPYVNDSKIENFIRDYIKKNEITHVIPAHDDAALLLSSLKGKLPAKVICSSEKTNIICRSKKRTYRELTNVVPTPKVYDLDNITSEIFPVFYKPDIGQGSKGVFKASSKDCLIGRNLTDYIACEYLPGEEVTIDCLSDLHSKLLFCGPRKRGRVNNGIATSTSTTKVEFDILQEYASLISKKIGLVGAWFFQMKKNKSGQFCLLEVSTRIAGSMSTNRVCGINFSELSILIHENQEIKLIENNFNVTQHRSLSNMYYTDLSYKYVYVDLDDCIIIDGEINIQLISFLYQSLNEGCEVNLVTRHEMCLETTLQQYRILNIFDNIYHLTDGQCKSSVMRKNESIFIDDSFSERLKVSTENIPTFSIDSVEVLLRYKK